MIWALCEDSTLCSLHLRLICCIFAPAEVTGPLAGVRMAGDPPGGLVNAPKMPPAFPSQQLRSDSRPLTPAVPSLHLQSLRTTLAFQIKDLLAGHLGA